MAFHNPYHFVPVKGTIHGSIDLTDNKSLSEQTLKHISFDRYHNNSFSGRLLCRMETVGPVIVGDKQKNDEETQYTPILPFERDGKPAIPGSTIRGCIASIAEAASNSALRVLNNQPFSRRVDMKEEVGEKIENFSALGMIIRKGDNFYLKPLTLPTLVKKRNNEYEIPQPFRRMFPEPDVKLKAYCYNRGNLDASTTLESYSEEHPDVYYAELIGTYTRKGNSITGSGGKTVKNILLGLTSTDPVSSHEIPVANSRLYTRGIIRSIYKSSRSDDIPKEKKHEFFIPFSEDDENDIRNGINLFPVKKEALDRFYRLASGRKTETDRRLGKGDSQDPLPFSLKGSEDFYNRAEPYRLKDRDIVFFVPSSDGTEVEKVFVSQIWREEYKDDLFTFFRDVNPELLPFSNERNKITPAEAIFGFVEINSDSEDNSAPDKFTRALASRISFTDATLIHFVDKYYEKEMKLKILASPKPPSPSFYFRRKNYRRSPQNPSDCYISKLDLNKREHIPQGRKFYLNHDINSVLYNARTQRPGENQSQKNIVTPISKSCHFLFRIEFENLSEKELGLLVYSLNPTDSFHHKIGMAKPLGFGTVKFHIDGLFLINRKKRYSDDEFLSDKLCRFHEVWLSTDMNEYFGLESHLDIYERSVPTCGAGVTPDNFKNSFSQDMIPEIAKSIELVGLPDINNVKYPVVENPALPEDEGFGWFMNNDNPPNIDSIKQGLKPLEFETQGTITGIREN